MPNRPRFSYAAQKVVWLGSAGRLVKISDNFLNPKRAGGGQNPPTATLKACRVVCDEAGGIKPSCNFPFGCLEQVDNINFGGCLWKLSKNLLYEKKSQRKWEIFFEKSIFFQIFQIKLYFFMSNLHLECFQLSFDVHIVHVDQKLWFFKNCGTES